MNKVMHVVLATLSILLIATAGGHAAIPTTMSYQGTLNNSAGNPVTGNFDMTFKLYDAPVGGETLLTEVHNGGNQVSVDSGIVDGVLGGVTPFALGFDTGYYPIARAPGFGAWIDVHMHFNNQISREWSQQQRRGQRGRRPGGRQSGPIGFTDADYLACADELIRTMDQYGLQRVVLMPQPRVSGQQGYYDYTSLLPSIRKYPDRILLGAGGGTLNSMIHGTDSAAVTGAVSSRFRAAAEQMVRDGAVVFAELSALHISRNNQHVFEAAPADHPLYLLLADIAAEHGLPIDIHMEAVVEDTVTPANLRRASSNNPARLTATVPGLERLLAHNRGAKIVWQHMGWDNTGQMTIALLSRMLDAHPNLYLGFKIEDREVQVGNGGPMPNRIVDAAGRIRPEWRQFFIDHADRVLVAADQFAGIPGKTQQSPSYMDMTYGAIAQLPEEVILKVARDNAIRVYRLHD